MNSTHIAVVHALFALAQADRHATVLRVVQEIADQVGEGSSVSRREVEEALRALDTAGFVDQSRVRLTMRGLAAAVLMPRVAPRRGLARKAA